MMRRTIVFTCVVGLTLLLVPSASADPPETEPNPEYTEMPVEGCDFPVLLVMRSGGFARTFDDMNVVVQRYTGSIHATIINQESEASIERNISGPLTYTEYPDGSWTYSFSGPTLFWDAFLTPSLPPVFINQGIYRFSGDADGNLELDFRVGRVEDICAALS